MERTALLLIRPVSAKNGSSHSRSDFWRPRRHRRTIGIGILRIPGSVAAQLSHSGLIMAAWIISGLYAFAGANTYAELGTMLPLDGGPYV